jgi:hypothetical protein
MRNLLARLLLVPALLFGLAGAAQAQTAVQQSASQLNAGIVCAVAANPAVNTQNTLTFTVPAGQSLYLTSVGVNVVADGTGGTTLAIGRFTSTNLQSFEIDVSFAGTVNTQLGYTTLANPAGLIKSAVGPVSATIVSPAGGAHNAYPMFACGYFAP